MATNGSPAYGTAGLARLSRIARAWSRGIWVIAAICLGAASPLRAELPYHRFDRLTPLGGSSGSTLEVEVAGNDLEGLQGLLFEHPGLKAEPVEGQERRFQLTIGAEVPSGTYDVWLQGRFGVSNPRLFAVSRGLTEIREVEPNNEASQAQRIEVDSAVNGNSDQNDQDQYRFAARRGERITIQCQASRLDSPLDSTLSVLSATGASLFSNGDYHGRDSFIDFVAPEDGEYLIVVHDLAYRGGHPYRLLVSRLPQVENIWPRVVRPGQPTELTLFGRNLGSGSLPSAWSIGELKLDELRQTVTAPPEVSALSTFRFLEHPTSYSTLPTAATCTLTGFQVTSGLPADVGDAATLLVADQPVTFESEPHNSRDQSQPLTLPALVNGRFDAPRDADWFSLTVPENGPYAIDVYCERINGRADPYVAVLDDQGNRVSELDDYGHRVNAFDGHLRDPSGMVNLSANRKYHILVQDRYQRGGARYQYVLRLRQPVPDFYAATIHHQNPGPGSTTIWRGGAAYLDVVVHQTEGFQGPITLQVEGLPPGVHAAPTVLNASNHGTLVLWADVDALESTGFIQVFATGTRQGPAGEESFRREVRPYTRVWTDAGMSSSRPQRRLPLAVRERAPFALAFTVPQVEVTAGQPATLTLQLARHWPEFKNAVAILPLVFPGNFKMSNGEISAERGELTFPLEVQPNTRPGDYTLAVIGQAQVPYHKNFEETNRPNTLVSLPSQPITVRVLPANPGNK